MNKLLRCALMLGICCKLIGISQAQPPDPEPPVVELPAPVQPIERVIKIRNTQPSLIAWWLHPRSTPEPFIIQIARKSYADLGLAHPFLGDSKWFGKSDDDDIKTKPVFTKAKAGEPVVIEGIHSVDSADNRNVLIAHGTKEGLDELEKIVAQLDERISSIEVELFIVPANEESAKTLGVSRDENGEFASPSQDLKEFESKLEMLRAEGNERILYGVRNSMMNGLGRNMSSTQTTPLTDLSVQVANKNFHYPQKTVDISNDNLLIVVSEKFSFFIEPTIKKDGQVSVFVDISNPIFLGTTYYKKPFLPYTIDEEDDKKGFIQPDPDVYKNDQSILLEKRTLLTNVLECPDDKVLFAGEFQTLVSTYGKVSNKAPEFRHEFCFVSARVLKR